MGNVCEADSEHAIDGPICENVKIGTIYDLSWRIYPAAVIAVGGAVLLWRGLRLGSGGLGDPPRNLRFVRGFRLTVIGLVLLAIASAWLWHQQWLLILALAIGARRRSSPRSTPGRSGDESNSKPPKPRSLRRRSEGRLYSAP
ncbi:MAG TPA: hypothetical protein QGI71_09630 [Dehalococcoidia bacterium]|nr:hypothetical protein [Dehalococcoidia bacterium]